ncbi:ribosome recycling factor [Roseibacillus ishigakijimensis]|uniref:Ribosome-recycling factor n=1 Tax=Roseibacillus ishigakijimensis TaxID=454146 RepID=A0A934RK88_9BACT|nr:ribosome recycling factor [Roseibacillus ishigakijimensis]MBK1832964.1 ribosome recycling factor [Roseibacillus ishigakijimensis]
MTPESSLAEVKEAMDKSFEYLEQEFGGVRTGKASPTLVDNLDVNVTSYGSVMKLKGLAVISVPEPRMLMVAPFDPSTTSDIEKAIREANLGVNPAIDGTNIRLVVPELTEERRKEMVKRVKAMAEDARVRVRNARKMGMDAGKKMKADNILTEDSQKDFEGEVQELTDAAVKKIDEAAAEKEAEVMTV